MQKSGKAIIYLGIFVLGITLFGVIPRLFLDVYMSPDETAVAVSAKFLAQHGTMKIADPLLARFPWLHPRSFVSQGGYMVPVGFLGLPILMALVYLFFGQFATLWFTPLLALSVVIPLWNLTKKMGSAAQILASLTWLTFPTVILYANRGLFPNLIVVALCIWAMYLFWIVWGEKNRAKDPAQYLYLGVAGLASGTALAIRPVEAFWIAVWFAAILAIRWDVIRTDRAKYKKAALFVLAGSMVPLIAAWFSYKTYGSFLAIGYNLRDTVLAPQASSVGQVSQNLLPFGLHPRALWANFRDYLFGMYWPWLLAAGLAIYFTWKGRTAKILAAAGFLTTIVLAIVYGQALYQDHVGVNVVSIGNSFLRYFLPLTPFFVLSVAATVQAIQKRFGQPKGLALFIIPFLALSVYGTYLGLYQDGEGAAISDQELLRYAEIRQQAQAQAGEDAVVLSDRSDKIFFPQFDAVSPMPEDDRMKELAAQNKVLMFMTTQDEAGMVDWQARGFNLMPLFSSSNQTLYELSL